MNKELEAFYKVLERAEFAYIGHEDVDMVIKALTPPTADEVCKALGEALNDEVYYNPSLKRFYSVRGDETKTIIGIYRGCIHTKWGFFTPRLNTMISKFYESLEEEK